MGEREEKLLEKARSFVLKGFSGEGSGHDHHHILRVHDRALKIHREEGEGDRFFIEMAAFLHDVGDTKFYNGDPEEGKRRLEEWMGAIGLLEEEKERIRRIVAGVTFQGAGKDDAVPDNETAIVQDADRLDAMGAIGIARAFAFGGSRGRPLHVPGSDGSEGASIEHFHEKLLLLKDRMKTQTGKRMAEDRHSFMESFLERFHEEWNGIR
jgi:uncharacterized protein